ncbi:MAG: LuxR family transcriptional regulator [Boseongicola sp.]|nr:MAG: LuxR family transcriptional regulator [Boseongicola sp.]
MKKFFDDDRWSEIDEFGQENLCVSESGDMAWAVYDGWARFRDGGRAHTYETRILEKLNGCWKIAYSSFAIRQGGAAIGLSVSLDGEGRIVASNEVSLAALKTHPHLTVSAGKLRARRLSWDKNLQRAISDAARHHGFFETHKYEIQMGRSPVYPVILGQSDDGGVAVVHFSIKDGVTNIRIDADDFLERRLRYAQVVFGLSDGQIRIARHIAMGDSLRRLSLKLDISSNTARTHLTRMYEKTGVNSQAALVRLLLSVG